QQQRIAPPGGEGRRVETVILDATWRSITCAVGEMQQRDPVGNAERLSLAQEGVDALAVERGIAATPEELQPPRVAPELAQRQDVLQRNPEDAPPGGLLGYERRTDPDRRARGSTGFVRETARRVEPPLA